jgi:small subunit ribosomal protein S16
MVRLRLRRVGGKKQPSYRIVAADKETARDGRFLDVVGSYNPRTARPPWSCRRPHLRLD